MTYKYDVGISALLGKTLVSVQTDGCEYIQFTTTDGHVYRMNHHSDCCECVEIEDIEGDLQSLVGNPILVAEASENNNNPKSQYEESFTWTFYKIATIKGHVDIRWYGSSNGYYSESVQFDQIEGE